MNDLPTLKIHLFGKHKVGKTALRNKIISENDYQKDKIEPTKLVEFSTKTINQKYTLLLIDYPGDTKGANLFDYLDSAGLICLIYDITNPKSFQDLRDEWISFFQRKNMINDNTNRILVIANKKDLYKNKDYSEFVEEEEGKTFAKQIGADFLSISVENGNVDEILTYFVEKCKLNNFEDKKDIKDVKDIKDINDIKGVNDKKVKESDYSCSCF